MRVPNKKEYSLIEAIEAIGQEIDPKVDIVTVKMVGSNKSPIVRVYIDYPGGVTFDVLAETQRWISGILDEIDPFPGSYTLEVSSPGPNRPLRKLAHFEKVVGETIQLKTKEGKLTGKLISVGENQVVVDETSIPFEQIITANVKDQN